MKAGLLLVTLSIVAVAQAQKYELTCSKSELSVRWPSYESNSEYYICPRLFGKQLTVTCEPGQVFTFALQSCTAPNRYIPAPGLDVLPTASPLMDKPNNEGYLTPLEITNVAPPMLKPAVIDMPVRQSPVISAEIPKPPVVAESPKQEEIKPVVITQEPAVPVATVEEHAKPLAPLPPTPAPTPPVVEDEPTKKSAVNKKKSSAKTSKNGKKNDKKDAKKTTKTEKAPKKTAKKPKTPAKKSPKEA